MLKYICIYGGVMDYTILNKTIYKANEHYVQYRIPGMVVTKKGTLLLYNEARTQGSDWAKMDIILARSTDGGKTFSDATILVQSDDTHKTVNNPVMVCDNDNKIHFFYCEDYSINGGRVLHSVSLDDGLTFSKPIDITKYTLPDVRNVFALGPGHGSCSNDGVLAIPFWTVLKSSDKEVSSHFPSVVGVLYSVDGGKTFKTSNLLEDKLATPSPNETSILALDDGSFYLNIRLNCNYRASAKFDTDFILKDYNEKLSLYDTICFGSTAKITLNGQQVILFANCDDRPDDYDETTVKLGTSVWSERKNVKLKCSFDFGKTFKNLLTIDPVKGGYVELAVDDDKKIIYVFYEEDFGSVCNLVALDGQKLIKND
jgi:sialidase-1